MITPFAQRWTYNGAQRFALPDSIFIPRLHEVAPIDEQTARKFVLNVHYSGSMPSARRCFGLYRGARLLGVAVFSMGVNSKTLTNAFGGAPCESLELGRFCLLDEAEFNAESFFIGACRTFLKREGFRGIVAFSDDLPRSTINGEIVHAGHIGTIYKASSAIYTGRSEKNTIRLLPDGKVFSARAVSKIRNLETGYIYAANILKSFGASEMPVEDEARREWLDLWLSKLTRRVRHPGNHRYLIPLQKGLDLPDGLPYPKVKFGQAYN